MSLEEQGVVINANPRFTFLAQEQTLVTSNCPETVSYNVSPSSGTSSSNLNFQLDVEGAFLNRGVEIDFGKIPLKFTRKAAIGGTAGAKTLADFFGDWDKISLRQFGMLNAIQSVQTIIDGQLHHTCNDVSSLIRTIAPYYDKNDVHQYFQASAPDLYYDYAHYGDAAKTVVVAGLDPTDALSIKKPAVATDNIFNALTGTYSTRIPVMKEITPGTLSNTSTVAQVHLMGQRCPIPFNIFGLHTDDIPLYLSKKVIVSIVLKANWAREIFSIVTVGNTSDMSDIEFYQTKVTDFVPRLNYEITVGPAYQEAERPNIKSLQLGIPTVTNLSGSRQIEVEGRSLKKVSQLQFQMDTIPIRAYLYAKALYKKADNVDPLKEARIPDLYGRIDSLNVKVGNAQTNIATADPGRIYHLCKTAGLNKSFEEYCYFTGGAVCLDFTEALGTKSNTLISSPGGGTASPQITFDLQFTNLSDAEVVYEVGCIAVYDTILTNKDSKWSMLSVITPSTFTTDQHINDVLANATVKRGNMLGSGFLDNLWGVVKKVGPGLWNLGKALITNKNGFREDLVKRWEGNGVGQFDSRAPTMGGNRQQPNGHEYTGGLSMDTWRTR
jgi:hypothetical protein